MAITPVLVALLPRATALYLSSHSPSVANQMLRFLAERRVEAELRERKAQVSSA